MRPTRASGTVRIGVSGWRYEPWRGAFYPPGLRQDDELAYAAERLPSIELNGSFYSLQTPASYADWYRATPPGFVFSVKGGRYITHVRRLKDIAKPLANFFASGLFNLKEKLGPILWQFPPNLKFDAGRFEDFMAMLPHDTEAALALARRRDARMTGRAALKVDASGRCATRSKSAIRRSSIRTSSAAAPLRHRAGGRRHRRTLAAAARRNGRLRLHAAARRHRAVQKPVQRGGAAGMGGADPRVGGGPAAADADLVVPAAPPRVPRDVFCYFDNTDKLHAPDNAQRLMELTAVTWSPLRRAVPRGRSVKPAVRRAA
jgi:uncharacterized protein YecE (DUF72 family)